MAIRNTEAALKEKENSLSSLEEAARVQQEEAQKNIVVSARDFIVVQSELIAAYFGSSGQI